MVALTKKIEAEKDNNNIGLRSSRKLSKQASEMVLQKGQPKQAQSPQVLHSKFSKQLSC
jgi:hypothetical protein